MPAIPLPRSLSPNDARILESRQLQTLGHAATVYARNVIHVAQSLKRSILPRQSANGVVIAIPAQYKGLNSGPAPGAVAGIVLGSVAGFLLLIWLLWVASSGSGFIRATTLNEEDVVVRRRSRSRGTRRSRRTEMTSRSPRRERIVRQERIVRDMPPPREASRIRETVILNDSRMPERRVDGDDIVEVIEEHSSIGVSPPRGKSRRGSQGYRSVYS
ncbi:hypothetical protein Slin15195_G096350 [Septoria linicola]|uniref:Uncharacterized protein n=1 Tax=Septoria linicola TaxID=215465 RepID=A0A9Q9B313_9PEZI|nr:hypothetical protein Slin14017_G059440 [Septoria linicola]USW56316.1 hypothetical protein Slin15195_G096350 [Septoria linicola]